MRRVAVVGHIEWVDFIPVPHHPRAGEVLHAASSFTRAAGGGGVAAVVLAELGAEVDFFCALGDDFDGHAALDQLTDRGVHVHAAWREEPTRRAVTLLEGHTERTIITIGKRLDPLGSDQLPWERLEGADGVYFTAGDEEALRRARAARTLVASPRARTALTHAGPHLDALVFSGHDHDEQHWAERLDDRAAVLVRTEGADGGEWWRGARGAREESGARGAREESGDRGARESRARTERRGLRGPLERRGAPVFRGPLERRGATVFRGPLERRGAPRQGRGLLRLRRFLRGGLYLFARGRRLDR